MQEEWRVALELSGQGGEEGLELSGQGGEEGLGRAAHGDARTTVPVPR